MTGNKVVFLLSYVVCSLFSDNLAAKTEKQSSDLTEQEVAEFRESVRQKYDLSETRYPAVLVKDVLGKLNRYNVVKLLQHWNNLSAKNRGKIIDAFQQAGFPSLVYLCFLESGALPKQVGSHGEIGLYQIKPAIAKSSCRLSANDLYDPVKNAECAVKILKARGAKENWLWALVQYNGVRRGCPTRGYLACLHEKFKKGNRAVIGSLYYSAKFLVYAELGRHYAAK